MKKLNAKSLKLNKKQISSFNLEQVKGGSLLYACETNLCTGLAGSCWCDEPGKKLTITTCISGNWCN